MISKMFYILNFMKNSLIIFLLFFFSFTFGQEFSFELFFEDSSGNQDSIILGYDENGSDGIDNAFGENNIISVPYNTGLDVRISDELKARNTLPNPISATYHTKKQIFQKNCPTNFSAQAIDIVTENWPVTITWNNLLFDNDCRNGTVFTGIDPGGWWDVSSLSEFECGFFRSEFLTENQVIICDNTNYPDFPASGSSFLTDDNLIVSVFWFTFANQSLLLNIENNDLPNIAIYPNPTENIVTFDTNKTNLKVEQIQLLDIFGRISEIEFSSNNSINLKGFESGIYFIRMSLKGGKSILKKIIKK